MGENKNVLDFCLAAARRKQKSNLQITLIQTLPVQLRCKD
jgi:hypothetical protein